MKKSDYTQTQMDRQWIRRCKQEELNFIDSYQGPKAQLIRKMESPKFSFYAPPERMSQTLLTRAEEKLKE
jgi:hypothetical protein